MIGSLCPRRDLYLQLLGTGVTSLAVGQSDLQYFLSMWTEASCWLTFVFILQGWDFWELNTTVLASLATTGMVTSDIMEMSQG